MFNILREKLGQTKLVVALPTKKPIIVKKIIKKMI